MESAFESRGRVSTREILSPSVYQQILTGGDTEMGWEDVGPATAFVSMGIIPPQTNDADAFFPTTNASS